MPDYLSTDPNEGDYLSTDPNEGEPQIGEDVTALMPAVGDDVTALMASHTSTPSPSEEERTWTDTAVDALPMIGGSIGGMLGRVPGAALGGAVGSGFRELARHAGDLPSAVADVARGLVRHPRETLRGGLDGMISGATDAAQEGATQGAAEAAGGLAMKGLQRGGRALYRGLLKPSLRVQEKFGGDAVVDALMQSGATISDRGVAKVARQLGDSRAEALRLIEEASGTAAPITAPEVVGKFAPVVKTLRRRADLGQPSEMATVGQRGRALVKRMGDGVSLSRAQALKEEADSLADGAHRAARMGQLRRLSADDMLDKATADGLREAIARRVPGLAARNAKTRTLMGAKRAISDAMGRTRNQFPVGGLRDMAAATLGNAVAGPAGLGVALASRALTSPRVGSAVALAMDRTGRAVPIDDVIRLLEGLASDNAPR